MADPAPLLLGFGDAVQSRQELLAGINHAQFGVRSRTERFGHGDTFARAQQAGIDEDADNSRPEGPRRSAAQTAESTPPERPQTTRSAGPTLFATCSSDRSMKASIVQFLGLRQTRSRKLPRMSGP